MRRARGAIRTRQRTAAAGLRGALLGDRFQPRADLRHVRAEVVDARQSGKGFETEHALEEPRRSVAHRAELAVAARLREEAAFHQPRDDTVDVDPADARDLRP